MHIIDTALVPPFPIEEEVDGFVKEPDDATEQDEPSEKPTTTEPAAQPQPSSALSRAASIALGIVVSNTIIR